MDDSEKKTPNMAAAEQLAVKPPEPVEMGTVRVLFAAKSRATSQ